MRCQIRSIFSSVQHKKRCFTECSHCSPWGCWAPIWKWNNSSIYSWVFFYVSSHKWENDVINSPSCHSKPVWLSSVEYNTKDLEEHWYPNNTEALWLSLYGEKHKSHLGNYLYSVCNVEVIQLWINWGWVNEDRMFRKILKIKGLYWHLVPWKTFKIHETFPLHKICFIVEKWSLDL